MSAQAEIAVPAERHTDQRPSTPLTWIDFAFIGIILIVLSLIGLPQISAGGLGWSDAPNHTFDGIFILELLKQRPWGHLREWAEQSYLHYPTLGIVVYYPPGFAVV